jgi:hypothetical protein
MRTDRESRAGDGPRPGARRATGRYATRAELTCNVWAIRRMQIYENVRSIADACGTSKNVVRLIIQTGEGLDDYLAEGCRLGAER